MQVKQWLIDMKKNRSHVCIRIYKSKFSNINSLKELEKEEANIQQIKNEVREKISFASNVEFHTKKRFYFCQINSVVKLIIKQKLYFKQL